MYYYTYKYIYIYFESNKYRIALVKNIESLRQVDKLSYRNILNRCSNEHEHRLIDPISTFHNLNYDQGIFMFLKIMILFGDNMVKHKTVFFQLGKGNHENRYFGFLRFCGLF